MLLVSFRILAGFETIGDAMYLQENSALVDIDSDLLDKIKDIQAILCRKKDISFNYTLNLILRHSLEKIN